MVNHCEGHVIFQDIKHQLQGNMLHQFLCYSVFIKSSLNWEVSSIHSKLFTGSFCDIASHINYLHTNFKDMTILYCYLNLLCIYY